MSKKTIMGVIIACSLFIIFVIQYSCTHETIGERNYRWQKEISNKSTKEYRLYEIKDSMNRFRDEIPDSEYNNLINRLRWLKISIRNKMEAFNKETYKDYKVYFNNEQVEVVNPDFHKKVVIAAATIQAVDSEHLQMEKNLFEDFVNKYVEITLSPTDSVYGIILEVKVNNITITNLLNEPSKVKVTRIIYVDRHGILQERSPLKVVLLSEDLKKKFNKDLNAHNLWWNGHSLQKIYTLRNSADFYGLVIKNGNDPTSLIEQQLSTVACITNQELRPGERVYISSMYKAYNGKTYYSVVSDSFKSGIIDSDNVRNEFPSEVYNIIYKDGSTRLGIVISAKLPNLEFINCFGQKVTAFDVVTYNVCFAKTKDFYKSMYKHNTVYDEKQVKSIISNNFDIQKNIKIVRDNPICSEVQLATNIHKAHIGLLGKTTSLIQDYKGNLYYIGSDSSGHMFIVNKADVVDI